MDQCVVLEGSICSCFNGETDYEIDCFGYQSVSPDDYQKLRDHFQEVTRRLDVCLASARRCE